MKKIPETNLVNLRVQSKNPIEHSPIEDDKLLHKIKASAARRVQLHKSTLQNA